MDKGIVLLLGSLTAALTLAGCHTQEHTGEQDSEVSTDDKIEGPPPQVESVQIVDAPDRAAPGEEMLVCWAIDGRGEAELTALYYDNESHPDDAFGATGADVLEHYRLGFVFPNNTDAVDEDGYSIPTTYCATLPMIEETLYMRAYVILDVPPGELSPEETVEVTSEFAIAPDMQEE